MRIQGKKLTALLLAFCIVLGLAACGSGGDDKNADTDQLSGTIYVPSFIDLDLEAEYINSACCDGQNVYVVADISNEEEVTDPETGVVSTNYSSRAAIFRISLEDGSVTELENYEPSYTFNSYDEGWFNIGSISAGLDGTLWVAEQATVYEFDLPEDFNEETDSKWDYQTSKNVELRRQLDSTGKELSVIDTSAMYEKLGEVDYINSVTVDAEGRFYVSISGENGSQIAVLDKDMNVLFSLENNAWGDFTLLGDGTVGVRRRDTEGNLSLSVLDTEAKAWGTDYPLPYTANNIYNGTDKYLFYYNGGESLYGYNAETQEGERLLSWSAADINMDRLVFFSFLPDGRVAAMTQDWARVNNGDDYSHKQITELAILEEKDASVLADKTVLTFATMGVNSDIRSAIIKFNKTNDKYRIEIKDYSEYSTEEDYQAGLTKLNTEILAGAAPDILSVSGLPLQQYGAKGILEDLWPLIENDPAIGRENLMERVFTAAEQDGKLYQVFANFGIDTVIGSRKVVGDDLGWTLEELKAALATMPEGCSIFDESDTKSGMLMYTMGMNTDAYVDWDSGECRFDSDEFKAMLEFCNSFPAEYDWESRGEDYEEEPVRITAGKQMLKRVSLGGFDDFQMYEAMFAGTEGLRTYESSYGSGGSYTVVTTGSASSSSASMGMDMNTFQRLIPGRYVTFKGYPMEDGSCGSSFSISNGIAMSSACKDKDGAWSFIRELLLPVADRKYYGDAYSWNFPTNKTDFDAAVAEAMEVEYETDSEGKQVLDQDGNPVERSKGGWSWGDSLSIDIVATTQEEYDQIMELYNAVETVTNYDTSIYDIISEMAGSYFTGDKGLDETASLIQGKVQLYINENR